MTTEQLKRVHNAVPFRPYAIRMADGQRYSIPHPEHLNFTPSARNVAVWHDDGSVSIVDLLLMTELELAPVPSS